MKDSYADFALLCKALSDETRLKIVDMLSCGEKCACEILKSFAITQPTLSYHMKILTACGIINARRDGAWMHYSLNADTTKLIAENWQSLTSRTDNCNCHRERSVCQTNGCESTNSGRSNDGQGKNNSSSF